MFQPDQRAPCHACEDGSQLFRNGCADGWPRTAGRNRAATRPSRGCQEVLLAGEGLGVACRAQEALPAGSHRKTVQTAAASLAERDEHLASLSATDLRGQQSLGQGLERFVQPSIVDGEFRRTAQRVVAEREGPGGRREHDVLRLLVGERAGPLRHGRRKYLEDRFRVSVSRARVPLPAAAGGSGDDRHARRRRGSVSPEDQQLPEVSGQEVDQQYQEEKGYSVAQAVRRAVEVPQKNHRQRARDRKDPESDQKLAEPEQSRGTGESGAKRQDRSLLHAGRL